METKKDEMNSYILQRGVVYYFLMCEINGADRKLWNFISDKFHMSGTLAAEIEKCVLSDVLNEFKSLEDISAYTSYLDGFCNDKSEFGKSRTERLILDAKLSALTKVAELFGSINVKSDRITGLSNVYKADRVGAVLYALQLMFSDKNGNCASLVCEILTDELEKRHSSDAGLILLNSDMANREDVFAVLCSLPDMMLQPGLIDELASEYGMEVKTFPDKKRKIGFEMR